MNCFLCNEKMVPYFCQSLYGYKRSFVRCPVCGLVIDETTYEMDEEEWSEKTEISIPPIRELRRIWLIQIGSIV